MDPLLKGDFQDEDRDLEVARISLINHRILYKRELVKFTQILTRLDIGPRQK